MEAGDWIAVIALAVGGASLVLTALERKTRITEVELLRRQVEVAESEREEKRRANVIAAHGPISGGYPYDRHEFEIANGGPAIARAIDVWTRSSEGEDLTDPFRLSPPTLAPHDQTTVRLMIKQAESRAGGLTLWGRWRDDYRRPGGRTPPA